GGVTSSGRRGGAPPRRVRADPARAGVGRAARASSGRDNRGMAPHEHHHGHDTHDHEHGSELSETQRRVRALETILTEKGYVDPAALHVLVATYETKVGPHNGARVVAKAWVDPEFRAWLFADGGAAITSLGYVG